MEVAELKTCTKCKLNQPISKFYKRTDTGKLCSFCSDCRSKRHKARYKSDPAYKTRLHTAAKQWATNNPLQTRYNRVKANALNPKRRQAREFTLSFEEVVALWQKGCHYCGISIVNDSGVGLDRRDNALGYTTINVLPCCGTCNKIRNDVLTVEEAEVAISAVIAYRSKV